MTSFQSFFFFFNFLNDDCEVCGKSGGVLILHILCSLSDEVKPLDETVIAVAIISIIIVIIIIIVVVWFIAKNR